MQIRILTVLALYFSGLHLSIGLVQGADEVEQVSVTKIWDAGSHNAFPDLIRYKDHFYCTFREADAHVGGDGRIRILTAADGQKWESIALIAEKGIDLRDPKLSITPKGQLMIVCGGSIYQGGRTLLGCQSRVFFSTDGKAWSDPHPVCEKGDWLWRVTWHDGTAYGVVYNVQAKPNQLKRGITLYKSVDGRDWKKVVDLDTKDRPNETTLRFLPNGEMVALVRHEEGSKQATIGHSKAPYTDWTWHSADYSVGGPNFIVMPDGTMWAGGRHTVKGQGARTALFRMTLKSLAPVLTLPSGGDNSYPGFVFYDDLLWMTYYSSHEAKTSIYLAKLRLPSK